MKWKRNKKLPLGTSEESSTPPPMLIKGEPSDTADSTSSLVTMSPT
jgi:hypothetical protein